MAYVAKVAQDSKTGFLISFQFVLGICLIFVPLGALASFLGGFLIKLNPGVAYFIGGVVIIAMGFWMMEVVKLPTPAFKWRFDVNRHCFWNHHSFTSCSNFN